MKKFYSILLSLILLLAFCVPCQASVCEVETTVVENGNEGTSVLNTAAPGTMNVKQVGTQVIPTTPLDGIENIVHQGEVIYRFKYEITARLSTGGYPVGYPQIYMPSCVVGCDTTAFDSSGVSYLEIDVRGVNTCNIRVKKDTLYAQFSVTPNVKCQYESPFYVTCYITAKESDYTGVKVSAAGITDTTFRSDFLDAVKLNGSGLADNDEYIRYAGNNTFAYGTPVTATQTTPVVGTTIAVDNEYIPRYAVGYQTYKRGRVYIDDIGTRIAEDSGGGINMYDIDVYVGAGKSKANGWENKYRAVTFNGTTTY